MERKGDANILLHTDMSLAPAFQPCFSPGWRCPTEEFLQDEHGACRSL